MFELSLMTIFCDCQQSFRGLCYYCMLVAFATVIGCSVELCIHGKLTLELWGLQFAPKPQQTA